MFQQTFRQARSAHLQHCAVAQGGKRLQRLIDDVTSGLSNASTTVYDLHLSLEILTSGLNRVFN